MNLERKSDMNLVYFFSPELNAIQRGTSASKVLTECERLTLRRAGLINTIDGKNKGHKLTKKAKRLLEELTDEA